MSMNFEFVHERLLVIGNKLMYKPVLLQLQTWSLQNISNTDVIKGLAIIVPILSNSNPYAIAEHTFNLK